MLLMLNTLKNYLVKHAFPSRIKEKKSVEAYNIWAENYDNQPDNLMLNVDGTMFNTLLQNLNLTHKDIADIGCGTGRHWQTILNLNPKKLVGFDVSAGMLKQLTAKFPTAKTEQITDDLFTSVPNNSYDIIISTLTIAHIKNIEIALNAWSRILKQNAEIIITDFHPKMLAFGGKRTFNHHNHTIAIENFVHYISSIKEILVANRFELVIEEEIIIDEQLKHFYMKKNALSIYENYKGFPVIYGLHFKRIA
jgi:ubiquinone/menaquinone biosynthesis C-methylase UbiE